MSDLIVTGIDNRDIGTTTLTLSDGRTVDVDPHELYLNMLENASPEDATNELERIEFEYGTGGRP